jgi:hypothetical protein
MKESVCTTCGAVGAAERVNFGQALLLGLLCAAGLLPGLVYLVILSTQYPRCAVCRAKTLVPAESPVGRRMLANQGRDPADLDALTGDKRRRNFWLDLTAISASVIVVLLVIADRLIG